MMAAGFDCATPLTRSTAARFKSDGFEFVCRYLVPSGWKRLTPEEADLISESGLNIVSVFETTADRALGGRQAGLVDGAIAVQVAEQVGQPKGSAIYFAVDFDATTAQMHTVIEYLRAAGEASPGFLTGVYGSYTVVEAARAAQVCSRFWQTYAWSRGRLSDAVHIYQYENDIFVNGVQIDRDVSYGDEGWWSKRQPVEPVDPNDPADPEDPVEPGEPVDPADPADPGDPGDPNNPPNNGDEEDDKMQLEQWQWKMLGDSLTEMYNIGLINDYTWAEKAYRGDMRQSELAWLNTIMLARSKGAQL